MANAENFGLGIGRQLSPYCALLLVGIVITGTLIALAAYTSFEPIPKSTLYEALVILLILFFLCMLSCGAAGVSGGLSAGGWGGGGWGAGGGDRGEKEGETLKLELDASRTEIAPGGAAQLTAHAISYRGSKSRDAKGEKIVFRVDSGRGRFSNGSRAMHAKTGSDGRATVGFIGPATIAGTEERDKVSAELPRKALRATVKITIKTSAPTPTTGNYTLTVARIPLRPPGTPVGIRVHVANVIPGGTVPRTLDVVFTKLGEGNGSFGGRPTRIEHPNAAGNCTAAFTTDPGTAHRNRVRIAVPGYATEIEVPVEIPPPPPIPPAAPAYHIEIDPIRAVEPGEESVITVHITHAEHPPGRAAEDIPIRFERITGNGIFVRDGALPRGINVTRNSARRGTRAVRFATDPEQENRIRIAVPGEAHILTLPLVQHEEPPRPQYRIAVDPIERVDPGRDSEITVHITHAERPGDTVPGIPIRFERTDGEGTFLPDVYAPGGNEIERNSRAGGERTVHFTTGPQPNSIRITVEGHTRDLEIPLTLAAEPEPIYRILPIRVRRAGPGEDIPIEVEIRPGTEGGEFPDDLEVVFEKAAEGGSFGGRDTATLGPYENGKYRAIFTTDADRARRNSVRISVPGDRVEFDIPPLPPEEYHITAETDNYHPRPGQRIDIRAHVTKKIEGGEPEDAEGVHITFRRVTGTGKFADGKTTLDDVQSGPGGLLEVPFTTDPNDPTAHNRIEVSVPGSTTSFSLMARPTATPSPIQIKFLTPPKIQGEPRSQRQTYLRGLDKIEIDIKATQGTEPAPDDTKVTVGIFDDHSNLVGERQTLNTGEGRISHEFPTGAESPPDGDYSLFARTEEEPTSSDSTDISIVTPKLEITAPKQNRRTRRIDIRQGTPIKISGKLDFGGIDPTKEPYKRAINVRLEDAEGNPKYRGGAGERATGIPINKDGSFTHSIPGTHTKTLDAGEYTLKLALAPKEPDLSKEIPINIVGAKREKWRGNFLPPEIMGKMRKDLGDLKYTFLSGERENKLKGYLKALPYASYLMTKGLVSYKTASFVTLFLKTDQKKQAQVLGWRKEPYKAFEEAIMKEFREMAVMRGEAPKEHAWVYDLILKDFIAQGSDVKKRKDILFNDLTRAMMAHANRTISVDLSKNNFKTFLARELKLREVMGADKLVEAGAEEKKSSKTAFELLKRISDTERKEIGTRARKFHRQLSYCLHYISKTNKFLPKRKIELKKRLLDFWKGAMDLFDFMYGGGPHNYEGIYKKVIKGNTDPEVEASVALAIGYFMRMPLSAMIIFALVGRKYEIGEIDLEEKAAEENKHEEKSTDENK